MSFSVQPSQEAASFTSLRLLEFSETVLTVTRQVYFFPFTTAEMTAVPDAFARSFPLLFTVTVFLLEDFHVTLLLVPVIFRVVDCPLRRVTFFLLIFTAALAVRGSIMDRSSSIKNSSRCFLLFFFIFLILSGMVII